MFLWVSFAEKAPIINCSQKDTFFQKRPKRAHDGDGFNASEEI